MLAKPLTAAALVLATGALMACGSSSDATTTTGAASLIDPTSAAATGAGTAAAATAGPVAVKLSEWAIAPTPAGAKAGKVTFDVTNSGSAPHEMVVLRTDKGAADLGKGARVPETGSVGETGDVASGKSKTVTLKLAKGHYVLICNIPGHYAAGMHTDFTVS